MTNQKPFVFTLMPFHQDFNDVWKLGIKETCEKLGTYCERVDEQLYEETMLERIYNQINKADIIVADMSGKNPNVFYEVGYAHALNKRVVLIIQDAAEIPFDLKHHAFLVYGNSIINLKDKLATKLQYLISNPSVIELPDTNGLEFFTKGHTIIQNGVIEMSIGHRYGLGKELNIDIQNTSNNNINDIQIGLLFDESLNDLSFHPNEEREKIIRPNGKILWLASAHKFDNFYPGSYKTAHFYFSNLLKKEITEPLEFEIQVFSPLGVRKLPFTISKEQTDPF